jgi:hypothetical protein
MTDQELEQIQAATRALLPLLKSKRAGRAAYAAIKALGRAAGVVADERPTTTIGAADIDDARAVVRDLGKISACLSGLLDSADAKVRNDAAELVITRLGNEPYASFRRAAEMNNNNAPVAQGE